MIIKFFFYSATTEEEGAGKASAAIPKPKTKLTPLSMNTSDEFIDEEEDLDDEEMDTEEDENDFLAMMKHNATKMTKSPVKKGLAGAKGSPVTVRKAAKYVMPIKTTQVTGQSHCCLIIKVVTIWCS